MLLIVVKRSLLLPILRLLLLSLFLSCMNLCSHLAQATIGDQCNFEKYATGCYSQANFVCDLQRNQCVCHPETPVLIAQKICLKRARENETCQYNEQCDNDNGLYCSYSDHKLLNNCLPIGFIRDYPRGISNPPRCKCIRVKQKQNNSHKSLPGSQQAKQLGSHQQVSQSPLPNASNWFRLVWMFLLVCLIGLILLLLMIKSQYYRIGRSFRQDDRISINSEADVPPPYEVAIRMKL